MRTRDQHNNFQLNTWIFQLCKLWNWPERHTKCYRSKMEVQNLLRGRGERMQKSVFHRENNRFNWLNISNSEQKVINITVITKNIKYVTYIKLLFTPIISLGLTQIISLEDNLIVRSLWITILTFKYAGWRALEGLWSLSELTGY